MGLRDLLVDPVLKWGLSAAAVGAVVLAAVQMWRGDAFVCPDGSIFADICKDVTVIVSDIPDGAVVAFNSRECPIGWDEYALAYGRFIRGIDKGNGKIDPDGKRDIGSTQDEDFLSHSHARPRDVYDAHGGNDASWVEHAPHFGYGHSNPPKTGKTGGSETRPDNVALLYCEKVRKM